MPVWERLAYTISNTRRGGITQPGRADGGKSWWRGARFLPPRAQLFGGGLAPPLFRAAEPASGEIGRDASGPRAGCAVLEEIDVAHHVEIIRVVDDDEAVPEAHHAAFRNRRQQTDHFYRNRLN